VIFLYKSQKTRQHNGQKKNHRRYDNTIVKTQITEGQTTQWPKEKSQKVRQHNGQKKNHRRSDNTMAKRKITEGQTVV
jgi:predicted carbohydrate-binding protein with CBM5 and CBM33 domain